jgi:hypothetical protein
LILSQPTTTGLKLTFYDVSTPTSVTSSNAITVGQYQLIEATQNGVNVGAIYTNGVLGATGTVNTLRGVNRTSNNVGTNNAQTIYFEGAIAEILIYNRIVTAAERLAIENFIVQKYQLNTVVPPAPIISIASGSLTGPTDVAIAQIGDGVTYITTDGTTPNTSSAVYSKPLNVYYSQTVKAISVKDGVSSSVATATYTLDSTLWPAPSGSDTTPLEIHLQLPTNAAPH